MQPYIDPTRKMTSKKKGRQPQKNGKKWKTTSKKLKLKMTSILFEKLE
jgi:hypothetical protein